MGPRAPSLWLLCIAGCVPRLDVPAAGNVRCTSDSQCPAGTSCLAQVAQRYCVTGDEPCITAEDGSSVPQPDGNACTLADGAGGGICLAAECVAPSCGDGVLTPPEVCDAGSANLDEPGATCREDCTLPRCGDRVVDPPEECDDGDAVDGDGCDSNCTFTACGNGLPTAGEICDDGNLVDGDGCDANCAPTGCGNNRTTVAEECDDGNTLTEACAYGEQSCGVCDGTCQLIAGATSWCGDGMVDTGAGEECDESGVDTLEGCATTCSRYDSCGDGVIHTLFEACDDSRNDDGDGCSAVCAVEVDRGCAGEPSVCFSVIYVDAAAAGAADGSRWADAFPSLQDAIAAAVGPVELWVAAGTYRPDEGMAHTPGDRGAAFPMQNGVAWYGGFAGTETHRAERDVNLNRTILSGDIGQPLSNADNSNTIVTSTSTDATAVLDGFWIEHGRALAQGSAAGGGLVSFQSAAIIRNCTFFSNHSHDGGGAVLNEQSDTTFVDCLFLGNTTNGDGPGGGAILNVDGDLTVSGSSFTSNMTAAAFGGAVRSTGAGTVTFDDCDISGNSAAAASGAGLSIIAGTAIIRNSRFTGNSTLASGGGGSGGALDIVGGASVTASGCSFVANERSAVFVSGGDFVVSSSEFVRNEGRIFGGAAILVFGGSTLEVSNVTFFENTELSSGSGGAIYVWSTSTALVHNSIFWGNTAQGMTDNVDSQDMPSFPVINHSIVEGGAPGTMVLTGDPLFNDPVAPDLTLQSTSPAIDAGDNAGVPAGELTDRAGNPRLVDITTVADTGAGTAPIVDIGAFEAQQ